MNSTLLKIAKTIFQGSLENYVLLVFSIVNVLIITKVVGGSAWLTLAFLLSIVVILWLKINDLVTSFLLVAIFSLQFYVPNKYYILEVFRPFDLLIGVGSYILSYGINLENIFILITFLLTLRNLLLKKWTLPINVIKSTVPIFFSGIVFFFVSLYSSVHISPYPNLSTTWLLQFMQMFFLAFIMLSVYLNEKVHFKLLPMVILSSIALQAVISIIQFLKQAPMGLPMESFRYSSVYYGAPDAVSSLFRVAGTFGGPNQLAIILAIMLVLVIPTISNSTKSLHMIIGLLGVGAIILTQSRSGWIALAAVIAAVFIMYKKEIAKLVSVFGPRRIYISIVLIVIGTSISLVSRIVASLNSFYEGAGALLRTEMIKEAGLAFLQSPWVGFGIGTNEHILLKLFPNGYVYSFPAPVHIAYLQLLLESGILGLASFMFPFFYILRYIINQYLNLGFKKMNRIKDSVFITITGIAVFGLFYLFQPHQGYLEFPYIGLILGYGILCIIDVKNLKNEI